MSRYEGFEIMSYNPSQDWYEEYRRLGGKMDRETYAHANEVFHHHTYNNFIGGDENLPMYHKG